jgi:hypothetical protein
MGTSRRPILSAGSVGPCASCWPPIRPRRSRPIGDALLLRSADAAAAIRLGLCIVHDVGAQHGFPLVRVGMHTGPAVERNVTEPVQVYSAVRQGAQSTAGLPIDRLVKGIARTSRQPSGRQGPGAKCRTLTHTAGTLPTQALTAAP